MSSIYHPDKWTLIVPRMPKSITDLCGILLSEDKYHVIDDPIKIWPELPMQLVGNRILTNCALPTGHLTSIVSSRLTHPLFDQTDWLIRLRSTIQQLQNTTVQVVRETAGNDLIRAACEVYEQPWLDVSIIETRSCLSAAFRVLIEDNALADDRFCIGKILLAADTPPLTDRHSGVPIRDQWSFYTSDNVFVLNNSGQGNIQSLVQYWLHKTQPVLSSDVKVADLPCWYKNGEYLSHFTRAIDGPCSGESQTEWYKKLVALDPHSFHTVERVLFKIVYEKKLKASSAMIRGGYTMIAFTAVPLNQWPELRKFRSHKRRWDFSPYGICINKNWLSKKVTKVQYGNADTWQVLTEAQKPYFQSKGERIDWTVEQEFRHKGDLDLSAIPREDAIVFVETDSDREFIQPFSPWPVHTFENLINIPEVHPVL